MNKYKRLASDTLIFGIGSFVTKFVYFLLMPFYTVALTKSEFGLADLLTNFSSLLTPLLTLCISDAVFRFTLDRNCDEKKLLNNGVRILGYSYILLSVGGVIAYIISLDLYWCLFVLLYVTESLKMLLSQFTRGLGKVKEFAINGVLGAVFLLFFSYFLLLYFHLGINGYLLAFVLSNLVSILYLFYRAKIFTFWDMKCYDSKLVREMLVYSLPLIPNMLSWWLTNISSRYIIVGYYGLSVAGLFAAASKIPALINIVASVFQQSWQYSSIRESQNIDNLVFYSRVFHYYSLSVIMACSVLLIFLPFISRFVLMGEFYSSWIYTPLLLFSAVLGCYSIFFGTFYTVVKKNKMAMYSTVYGAVLNVILCCFLIPLIGVYGALIANVLSYFIIVGIRMYDTRKYVSISIVWHQFIGGNLILLIQAILLTVLSNDSIIYSIISFLLIIAVYRKSFLDIMVFIKNNRKL